MTRINPYDARNYSAGSDPAPVPKNTIVANRLRSDIIGGVLPSGTRIPMSTVAAELGVSVQPVREALQLLEGEGLIEMIPNRGAIVRRMDRMTLIHTHEIGAGIELYLTRQFADDAPPSALRQAADLQRAHDAAAETLDWAEMDRANFVFHRYINTFGGNTAAADLVSRNYGLSHGILIRAGRDRSYADRVRAEHHALLDAFRSHDTETAMRISYAHTRATLENVLEAFDRGL